MVLHLSNVTAHTGLHSSLHMALDIKKVITWRCIFVGAFSFTPLSCFFFFIGKARCFYFVLFLGFPMDMCLIQAVNAYHCSWYRAVWGYHLLFLKWSFKSPSFLSSQQSNSECTRTPSQNWNVKVTAGSHVLTRSFRGRCPWSDFTSFQSITLRTFQ